MTLASPVSSHFPPPQQLQNEEKLKKEIEEWNPNENPHAEGTDPYTTLFVARLDYEVTEEQLRSAFEKYGKIRKCRIVTDSEGNNRGYGFLEFDHKGDQDAAYRYGGSGNTIIGTRVVLVDKEKGRIVKTWRPRRLGGGLGRTRMGRPSQNEPSARKVTPREPRGSDRDRYDDRDRRGGDRDRRDERDRGGRDRRERDSRRDDRYDDRRSRDDRRDDRRGDRHSYVTN